MYNLVLLRRVYTSDVGRVLARCLAALFSVFLVSHAWSQAGGSGEGVFHDPNQSGPTSPFVVIWNIGSNRGLTYHETEITPLYDFIRLVNSPRLAGSAADGVLRYGCPTTTNQFVFSNHPANGATFIVGGMVESTGLGYDWPTGNRHVNDGGGLVAQGYYRLVFSRKYHDSSKPPTYFEFNAWITNGVWHTNPPERTPTTGGQYYDPVVVSGYSRIVVRCIVAGQERSVQATVTGPNNGIGPTPFNLAPVNTGQYLVKVSGQVPGSTPGTSITLYNEHEFNIGHPQVRNVIFHFDAAGNPTGTGSTGGGTGGGGTYTGPPGETSWWEALFSSLFVPDPENVEAFADRYSEFTNWGPGAIYNQLQSAWTTQNNNVNTGVTPYGLGGSGAPIIKIPMDAFGASEVGLGPLPDLEIDMLGGFNEDASDGITDGNSLWGNWIRPWLGYSVYLGFGFFLLNRFWPRHTL